MAELLQQFIERTIETADKRNLAVENPVTLMIDIDDNGTKFYVVVSHLEPNHVTLPFNVTWVVADPSSPNYKKALRRASALPLGGYRNTWVELRAYQDFLDEMQFWDLTSTFQVGEVQISGVREASTIARGLFYLNFDSPEPNNPVVVGSNDSRMSDARQPLPHEHPMLPATMLAGSTGINQFYVTISDGESPETGEILVITEAGDEAGEYMGYWRLPEASDIVYDGPAFTELLINGPVGDTLDERVPFPFTADAHFSDGSVVSSVPATWDIIANTLAGTISSSTGAFVSNDVTGQQVVRIRATWVHPASGVQQVGLFDLTVNDTTITANLVSIEVIASRSTVNEGSNTVQYTVQATYDDGTISGVTPTTFISSNAAAGTLDSVTGIFTSALNVDQDELTTLTATYVENGITRSNSIDLTVIDTTIYPQSAEIQGPSSVDENSTATYVLVVTFTDATTSQVAVTDWAINNAAAGSIDASSGLLTTPTNLNANETARLSASYTSNGRTVTAVLDITARDTSVYPQSATILGPVQVNEGATQLYQLEVTFSDSTVQTVSVTDWTSSAPGVAAINASSGQLTAAADLLSNQSTNISASFTQNGITVNATLAVTVVDTTNYPVSAVIVGSASMPEGGDNQNLVLRVTYTDGSTADVVAAWTSSAPGVATIDSTGKVTTASNLIGNGSTVITATYTEEGVSFSENFTLTVTDETSYPTSARIIGPVTVSENTTVVYSLEVTYDDGRKVTEPVSTFSSSNINAGTMTNTGQLTAPGTMLTNQTTVISASFTLDGTTVNATMSVTVTDDTVYPASAAIIGPANVDEETTQTYQLEVTFTDASKQIVSVTDWASSATGIAIINANTGLLTALTVSSDTYVTISASYTSEGQTVNASLQIMVRDTSVYPVSATIIGAATVNENASETYTLSVTFSDSTSSTVAVTNWARSNANAGVINPTTGVFQAVANVQADTNTNITASYTSSGVTVNATKTITVVDITAYPQSATVIGPVTVDENGTATYILRVTFDDSSVQDVSVTDWAIDNASAGTIEPTTGLFTAANNETGLNIPAIISASYTLDGVSVSASLGIGVVDTTTGVVSAVIESVPSGVTEVDEGGTVQYRFIVTYSNATTMERTPTWTRDNATAGNIDASGLFTASGDFVGDKSVTISASYTEDGVTVGDTVALTVRDTIKRPVSMVVNGPASIPETANQAYTLEVTYDDGTTAPVTAGDWASSNALAGSINSTTGVFTPANVTEDKTTTLSASYTENGVTVNGSLLVTVTYIRVPTSASILGATSVNEGDNVTYSLQVTFDDGSSETIPVTNWSSTNASAGTLTTAGQFSAVGNVSANTTTNISASYTEAGQTVSDTVTVTVLNTANLPVSAVIVGVDTINEGNSTTYTLRIHYEDGTTNIVAVSDWASSNPAAGSIDAASGVFTAAEVSQNESTNITASFTEHGQTVQDSLALSVIDVEPVSASIIGQTTVQENTSVTYQFRVLYTNGAQVVHSISNWSYSDPTGGSVNASTGQFTAVEVTADRVGTLSGSYTENGTTVSATLNITVSNSAVVVGAGMPRWGYNTFSGIAQDENGHTGPQELVESMTGYAILATANSGEQFEATKPDADTYVYFLCPVSVGHASFLDTSTSFTGGWDGATWSLDPFSDGSFMNSGPVEVTYDDGTGPAQWYLYRTDYPGPESAKLWQVSYA